MDRFGRVVRAEVRAVTQHGAIVHQIAFAKQLLSALDILGRKQCLPGRIGHRFGNRCSCLINVCAADQHDGKSEQQRQQKPVLPKPRISLCGLILRVLTHELRSLSAQ